MVWFMNTADKPIIKAAEAVKLIRSGVTDTALMRMYRISALGLESLYRKLVEAGFIQESELERRMLMSSMSHAVDLDSYPSPGREKAKLRIRTSDAVKCIRAGMDDAALMENFTISTRGLESLFNKLLDSGAISPAELDARKNCFQWAEVAYVDVGNNVPAEDEEPDQPHFYAEQALTAPSDEKKKVLIAALSGFAAGALVMAVVFWVIAGVGSIRGKSDSSGAQVNTSARPADPPRDQVEIIIKALETITRSDSPQAREEGSQVRSTYQECLRNCENEFGGRDDVERALYHNCRRACTVEFSDRLKRMRDRYSGPSLE